MAGCRRAPGKTGACGQLGLRTADRMAVPQSPSVRERAYPARLGPARTARIYRGERRAGAAIGIVGNQIVARYKLVVGRRINSAKLIADARHSWLYALSSAGAMAGLIAVALGQPWGDPVAGLAVTAYICHVGYEVTAGVVHRLADGIDPSVISGAEAAAGSVPGVIHAHARARTCLAATLMNWAVRSRPRWPGKFPTQEASPGLPALVGPEREA
jgi:hypothetical protein